MDKIKVSIVGGSGYGGGELLRILLAHPNVDIHQITSRRYNKFPVTIPHPNLRGITGLKFCRVEDLEDVDVIFLAMPHKESQKNIDYYISKSKKVIDLASDFRLDSRDRYEKWYGEHLRPELMESFAYGIPEINREKIAKSEHVAAAGCEATCTTLTLYPLIMEKLIETDRVIIDSKIGSSTAGNKASSSSHHPERSGVVRSTKPTMHRHTAEIEMNLGVQASMSETSIDMVRGILVTCHVFLKRELNVVDIWKVYNKYYKDEYFIRLIKDKMGLYRYPEPKILAGTNFCDISFQIDRNSNRLVAIGAIDNLVKGTAGQAVQCMNIINGWGEWVGLEFPGLHPV